MTKAVKVLSHDEMIAHLRSMREVPRTTKLSGPENRVLIAIRNFYKKYGYSPTYAEIDEKLGFRSWPSVTRLIETNRLTKVKHKHRCFRLIE